MKIKLSKSQWEEAGKKAGWVKESQSLIGTPSAPITTPVPDNDTYNERFKFDVEKILSKMDSLSYNLNSEKFREKNNDKGIDYSLIGLSGVKDSIEREGKEISEMINDLFAKKQHWGLD
jgi:hypothetical protein